MGAAVPYAGGIVLDVSGMDEIVEIDEVSLTATVQAGMNGSEFERRLNERGLSFPHFPASAEWASVGGYVAARGSGVLSSRYGKIEDQVVAVRVVTPTGEIIDTIPVPRHAVGPELTQLFVGSEGTLGVITQVTVRLVPLPAYRRFEAVALPSLEAGIVGLRTTMQRGLRPAVIRFYDAEAAAGSLSPVVGQALDSATALLMFEGEAGRRRRGGGDRAWLPRPRRAARGSTSSSAARGGSTATTSTTRRTTRRCRRCGARSTRWRRTSGSSRSTTRCAPALKPYEAQGLRLRTHLSHWYEWGSMVYPRFVIPDASGADDPLALYYEIWGAGVNAILDAGGVMNDHHGVGSTLSQYVPRQWGAAHATLARIKAALDPAGIMNPGKLGLPAA